MMKNSLLLLLLFPVLLQAQTIKNSQIKTDKKTAEQSFEAMMDSIATELKVPNSPENVITIKEFISDEDVFRSVDIYPTFKGGRNAWVSYLQKNLDGNYVAEDQDSLSLATYGSVQRVIVQFLVCEDGSLCNYTVENSTKVSRAAVEEALRVMKKSPRWNPGTINNKSVKCYYKQPITFVISE